MKKNNWKSVYSTISKILESIIQKSLQKGRYEFTVERKQNNEILMLVRT